MKACLAGLLAVGFWSGTAAAQAGDAGRGERLFNTQCKTCHTVEKDGKHGIGSNLHGTFGRKAGTVEGFDSSAALKASGIVWDDATLADFLRNPKGRVPDNKMVFAGIRRQEQLDELIAYLKKAAQ